MTKRAVAAVSPHLQVIPYVLVPRAYEYLTAPAAYFSYPGNDIAFFTTIEISGL